MEHEFCTPFIAIVFQQEVNKCQRRIIGYHRTVLLEVLQAVNNRCGITDRLRLAFVIGMISLVLDLLDLINYLKGNDKDLLKK